MRIKFENLTTEQVMEIAIEAMDYLDSVEFICKWMSYEPVDQVEELIAQLEAILEERGEK